MPHQPPPRYAEPVHEAPHRAGEVGEPIPRARLRRGAETRKVEGEDGGAAGERGDVVPPGLREPPQTVNEDDGRSATFDDIVQAEPVDLAAPKLQFRHGATILPEVLR